MGCSFQAKPAVGFGKAPYPSQSLPRGQYTEQVSPHLWSLKPEVLGENGERQLFEAELLARR